METTPNKLDKTRAELILSEIKDKLVPEEIDFYHKLITQIFEETELNQLSSYDRVRVLNEIIQIITVLYMNAPYELVALGYYFLVASGKINHEAMVDSVAEVISNVDFSKYNR